MTSTTFEIPGPPVVWKRARRRSSQYFTDPKQAAYQRDVMATARAAGLRPISGPVGVLATFSLPIAASVSKRRRAAMLGGPADTSPKDTDNLAKGILDALNGVAYADDRQVTELTTSKVWGEPGARVTVYPVVLQ